MQSRQGEELDTLMKPKPIAASASLCGIEMWREKEAMERFMTLASDEDYFALKSSPSLLPHCCG